MRTQPLPLLVLTGFLGSGKTSTLSHWLAGTDIPLKRVAVIINDFGSVNVDAALLARRQLELRSITGGCVCCQSFDDLVEQVSTLADNPDLDLVWIETSGLADPEEVLDHLSAPALQARTVIQRVIMVVDGSDFPCSWRGRAVQEEQVRYADLILLNKTDRIDATLRNKVEHALHEINPAAEIVVTQHGKVAPEILITGHHHDLSAPSDSCSHDPCDHAHHGHDHHHHEHDHDHANGGHRPPLQEDHHHDHLPHAASTLFLPLAAPVDRAAFQVFLSKLPKSVFRAKGFIRLTESPGQLHTFQQVRDQAELLLLPLQDDADMATGLVLIGPNLDENHVRELAGELLPLAVPR